MTREELINFGEMFLEVNRDSKNSNTYQFINEAIKLFKQETCEDAISREAVLDILCENKEYYQSESQYDRIEKLPSVQPTRPRGKIIYKAPYGWGYCSKCNTIVEPQDRFCSFCGADIDTRGEDET